MSRLINKTLSRAQDAKQESKHLDFKGRFDPTSLECWCELVKDIVAFANSGGGVILFGLDSKGVSTGFDCSAVLDIDIADITNKIFKYTGHHFGDVQISPLPRANERYPAMVVGDAEIPMVFTKPGEYEADAKKKSAFAAGTIYFRHGAKSEIGTRADIEAWHHRRLSAERERLMKGVKQVVGAPLDHVLSVVPKTAQISPNGIVARLSTDPTAIQVRPLNTGQFYPHRKAELLSKINRGLPQGIKLNPHDIICLNRKYNVIDGRPDFATRPHPKASPLYSDQYADWIISEVNKAKNFVSEARNAYRDHQRRKSAAKKRKGSG